MLDLKKCIQLYNINGKKWLITAKNAKYNFIYELVNVSDVWIRFWIRKTIF